MSHVCTCLHTCTWRFVCFFLFTLRGVCNTLVLENCCFVLYYFTCVHSQYGTCAHFYNSGPGETALPLTLPYHLNGNKAYLTWLMQSQTMRLPPLCFTDERRFWCYCKALVSCLTSVTSGALLSPNYFPAAPLHTHCNIWCHSCVRAVSNKQVLTKGFEPGIQHQLIRTWSGFYSLMNL